MNKIWTAVDSPLMPGYPTPGVRAYYADTPASLLYRIKHKEILTLTSINMSGTTGSPWTMSDGLSYAFLVVTDEEYQADGAAPEVLDNILAEIHEGGYSVINQN